LDQGRATYHGFLSREDLAELLLRCGYIVSASQYEGYGLSIVEGMSVGLLPVMHDNAAFREIRELSGCGLICNFDVPAEAAEAFTRWRANRTLVDRKRAAEFAHAQSWDIVESTVESYYDKVGGA
jgi:alpha-1,3-mannosyltransferase